MKTCGDTHEHTAEYTRVFKLLVAIVFHCLSVSLSLCLSPLSCLDPRLWPISCVRVVVVSEKLRLSSLSPTLRNEEHMSLRGETPMTEALLPTRSNSVSNWAMSLFRVPLFTELCHFPKLLIVDEVGIWSLRSVGRPSICCFTDLRGRARGQTRQVLC